jgi:DNA replication initiation complex subunit (GINS family)
MNKEEFEVKITYQTLFELFRLENNREELQKLNASFFNDVSEYMKGKKSWIESKKNNIDLFAAEESRKADIEIESIRKIIRKLYEKRESKIINAAIDSSRSNSAIIDTSSMLSEERKMYEEIVERLDNFRNGLLAKVLNAENPTIEVKPDIPAPIAEESKEDCLETQKEENCDSLGIPEDEENDVEFENPVQAEESGTEELASVEFKEKMSKFVGDDFNEYGPFEAGEHAKLPPG